jgi:hypothetical protein
MKKNGKKLSLSRETVLALAGVSGGDWFTLICMPTGPGCAQSAGFTNCQQSCYYTCGCEGSNTCTGYSAAGHNCIDNKY